VYLLAKVGYKHLFWLIMAINLIMVGGAMAINLYALAVVLVGLVFVNQYSFPPLRLKAHPLFGLLAFAQAVIIPFLLGGVTHLEGGIQAAAEASLFLLL
jgi:4-hydroxybenzoate polyprenyltransferase